MEALVIIVIKKRKEEIKMKKLLTLMFCVSLCLGISGCSNNEKDVKSSETENKKAESKKVESMSFDRFEKILNENGYTITEKVPMAAQMIGGEEGIKYKTDSEKFELYRFNTSSDAYKKAKENGSLTLEGFGDFPVLVNGEYVLLIDNVDQKVIDAFNK